MKQATIYKIKRQEQLASLPKPANPFPEKKMAVGIVRVSSFGQQDNNSEAVQSNSISHYAEEAGLHLVAIFSIVESAKASEDRKIFKAIDAWTEKWKVSARVFYKQDREARNVTDVESMFDRIEAGKLELHYALSRQVLDKNSTANDFMFRTIVGAVDAQYSRELKKKIQVGTQAKAESGWYPGNHAPLGYVHQKSLNCAGVERRRGSVIVRHPDARKVQQVQREFALRAIGYTYEDIRKTIIDEGFIPLDAVDRYRACTIEKRIKNPFYGGTFVWDGVEYPGNHELIVDPLVYAKALGKIGTRGVYGKVDGLFAKGWLVCGTEGCGCNVLYDPKKKTLQSGEEKVYKLYHCSNGRGVHKSMKGLNVHEESIWEQFGEAVSSISITPDWAKQLAEALNETRHKVQDAIRRDLGNYKLKLKMLEEKEDHLYDSYQAQILDAEGYRRQVLKVRGQRSELTELMGAAHLKISDAGMESAKSILELATDAESLWKTRSPQERVQFLKLILSNQVLDGATIRYQLKKPLQTLSEMKGKSDWRTERDSNS